ncbi:hypothetical protein AKJ09_07415 [Labilithrix luteola]|uniref:Uncharacterized protein n=1 Tax=Labilithrix luteola TaxID=1391654 RepID=A0A0K1Q525_9BACT|nr:hypothetical protein [Labilithrix luteola]AKV00752.1 hypothetical protein AKJ09_07415 [Labilithrix luteola]
MRDVARLPVGLVMGLVMGLGSAGLALAQSDAVVHVEYAASGGSGGCPSSASFIEQLRSRSHRIRVSDRTDGARTIVVRVEAHDGRSAGRLTIREVDGGEAERSVQGSTCSEVVSSLAFVAAVAVDPGASLLPEPHAVSPAATAAPAPPASKAGGSIPAAPAPSATPQETTTTTPPPTVANGGSDEREPPSRTERASNEDGNDARPTAKSWELAVGLDGQVLSGPAPSVVFVLPVFVEIASSHRGLLSPSARLHFERLNTSSQTAGAGAEFTWTAGGLDLCPVAWSPDRFRIAPCLRTEVGVLQGGGIGVQPARSSSRLWLSTGAAAHVRWMAFRPVFVDLEAGLGAPLVRDRFFVQQNTMVFRVPDAEWSAALGVGATIW